MSKSVDVLAVLDRAAVYAINADHEFADLEYAAIIQARAAVAELIEAAAPAASDEGMDQPEIDRLRAAVARVKGIGQ